MLPPFFNVNHLLLHVNSGDFVVSRRTSLFSRLSDFLPDTQKYLAPTKFIRYKEKSFSC